ncbi:MAG: hypothetical protein J0L83_12915 [Chitinophagales bacterium]|jgi:hypothetical protein|nr:hypothetical protein [Chitinophagales bacterium]
MNVKHELQIIISGISNHATENLICAAAHYLRKSKEASGSSQKPKFTKEEETEKLIEWITDNQLWFTSHAESRFIASGAEQRVYLDQDERYVYKLNDSVFYQFWSEYFHSLLMYLTN